MRKVQAANLPVFGLDLRPAKPYSPRLRRGTGYQYGIESIGFVTRGFSATVLNLLLMALMIARVQGRVSEAEEQRYLTSCSGWRRLSGCYRPHLALYRQARRSAAGGERFIAIGYGALVGVAKEFEPNLPRRCGSLLVDLNLRPICTAPIWRRTPVT